MLRMRTLVAPAAAAAGLAVAVAGLPVAGAGAAAVPVKSSSSLTSYHGTVTSVSTANRTFRLRSSSGTTRTFRVTSATVFERLSGLSSLRNKAVEVKGKRLDGRWVARKIEPDDDRSGDDNGGGRGGSDDGSGGHGSDD